MIKFHIKWTAFYIYSCFVKINYKVFGPESYNSYSAEESLKIFSLENYLFPIICYLYVIIMIIFNLFISLFLKEN